MLSGLRAWADLVTNLSPTLEHSWLALARGAQHYQVIEITYHLWAQCSKTEAFTILKAAILLGAKD